MRRPLFIVLAAALGAGLLPALPGSAITPAGFDCGPDDGRDWLTPAGFQLDFTAPDRASFGHDIAALGGQQWPESVMQQSTAHFPFRLMAAPNTAADLDISISWEGTGDMDLDVYDEEGNELGASHTFNPLDGNGESVELLGVSHCTDLRVEVNNYAARSDEVVSLDIDVTPAGAVFACELDDPHPACAGKAAGEAPEPPADPRTRLYFTSDRPGQAAMAVDYVMKTAENPDRPLDSSLTTARPATGAANSFTHTGQGVADQNQNPFMAHFTTPVAQTTQLDGPVQAALWVSSATLRGVGDEPPGMLYVDLYADSFGSALSGVHLGRVEVPGEAIGDAPTRLTVTFEDVEATVEEELTVQVASEPVASSGGETGSPSDAHWTLWYDSVQFPSHLALTLPEGALPPS